MDLTSPEMAPILAAITIKDDPARRRARLLELWAELSAAGNPLQLCALGHVLADTEAEAANELEWDLRALEAATGSRAAEDLGPVPPVPESYLPSLHLSVAADYRKLGDLGQARRHLACASNHLPPCPTTPTAPRSGQPTGGSRRRSGTAHRNLARLTAPSAARSGRGCRSR